MLPILGISKQLVDRIKVWNEFLKLLEEYVYIFGDEPFDWEIFQLLLHTGFEHTHYNMAPSTLDQLTCTGIDSVRYSPKKGYICYWVISRRPS